MIVIEIDNRGSKSIVIINTFVKEQRADGSWQVKSNQTLLSNRYLACLRYALMGFERNYPYRLLWELSNKSSHNNPLRFLSEKININIVRLYSS